MKNLRKTFIERVTLFVLAGVFGATLLPFVASAATLYDTADDEEYASNTQKGVQEYSWSGSDYTMVPDWTITSITTQYRRTGGTGALNVDAFIHTSSDYGGNVAGDVQSTSNADQHEYTWTFFPGINLRDVAEATGNSSGAVYIGIGVSSGTASFRVHRQTAAEPEGVFRVSSGTPGGALTATFTGTQLSTVSEITDVLLPSPPSQVSAATSTTFSFEYTSALPNLSYAGIVYEKISPAQVQYQPVTEIVTQSGSGLTFSETIEFDDNSQYTWKAVLWDDDFNIVDQSSLYTWSVGTLSNVSYDPTLLQDVLDAAPTASSTPAIFLNTIINAFKNLAPFSYYEQIKVALDNASASLENGDSLPTTAIPFGNASSTIYFTVDFLDVDDITSLTGTGVWDTLKSVIAIALWLSLAWAIWGTLQHRFSVK